MYRSMAHYDSLRYRLLPYIYTLAADTWFRDGTIMRGLVMDFPADPAVRRIDDEYLFGHDLLVAPVTDYKARTRALYLPAGADWYDFDTGRFEAGGRRISVAAPAERIPVFVRAGSIVPTGPALQSTAGDRPDAPVTLNVFTGADGSFSLYDDDGTSMAYQKGAWSRIPIAWDERTKMLTIGAREGRWPGMAARRTIAIRWTTPTRPRGLDPDASPDATIIYTGARQAIRLPR
jgi:alpha-D-xyloside xylohydrolase